jgi:uncharacterized repeat protein (TIGR01451 family)
MAQELSLLKINDGGQLEGGQIVWRIGALAPREERRLSLSAIAERLTPTARNVAVATADPNAFVQSDAVIEIRGAPGLKVEVVDIGDPARVGGLIRYEISVTNSGTLADANLALSATVPQQMDVQSGLGPLNAQPRIVGNEITFPPIDRLEPGQRLVYEVIARAKTPGDARFRVRLQTATLGAEPVVKEQSTTIYMPESSRLMP